MKKFFAIVFTAVLAMSLTGCDKEVARKLAEKVHRDYYCVLLESDAGKREMNNRESMDRTAMRNGFRDWKDFEARAVAVLGEKEWEEVTESADRWFEKALEEKLGVKPGEVEFGKECRQDEQEDEEEEDEGEEEEWDDSELPPVFKAGAKLADAERKEYYEIKEVRGEWFRGDHYKIRGDATDLMAKNAWVYAPGKGWDWVVYEP